MRVIELTWVCSSCAETNRGRDKKCGKCGKPKEEGEKFAMPADTRAVASVVDPELVARAKAGIDWPCGYCATVNVATNAACTNCGAPVGTRPAKPAPPPALVSGAPRGYSCLPIVVLAGAVGVFGIVAVGFVVAASSRRAPDVVIAVPPAPTSEVVSATVTDAHWTRTVSIERRELVAHEGFAEQEPADALDVAQDGVRHHHDEQVQQGTTTEQYFEDVPYTDTETTMEPQPCGEDCTETPPTCHEVCEDNGNGFATCHDECTGGGHTCTPRTCMQPVTRTVQRTRQEPRTREVPHLVTVPRDAPWFRWRSWDWVHARDVVREGGATDAPSWPEDAELAPDGALADGESERSTRRAQLDVTLRDARGRELHYAPGDDAELVRLAPGAVVRAEVGLPGGYLMRLLPADEAVDGGP